MAPTLGTAASLPPSLRVLVIALGGFRFFREHDCDCLLATLHFLAALAAGVKLAPLELAQHLVIRHGVSPLWHARQLRDSGDPAGLAGDGTEPQAVAPGAAVVEVDRGRIERQRAERVPDRHEARAHVVARHVARRASEER